MIEWETCENGVRMMLSIDDFIIRSRLGGTAHRKAILCACDCASLASGVARDARPIIAIIEARRYACGVTRKQNAVAAADEARKAYNEYYRKNILFDENYRISRACLSATCILDSCYGTATAALVALFPTINYPGAKPDDLDGAHKTRKVIADIVRRYYRQAPE